MNAFANDGSFMERFSSQAAGALKALIFANLVLAGQHDELQKNAVGAQSIDSC